MPALEVFGGPLNLWKKHFYRNITSASTIVVVLPTLAFYCLFLTVALVNCVSGRINFEVLRGSRGFFY